MRVVNVNVKPVLAKTNDSVMTTTRRSLVAMAAISIAVLLAFHFQVAGLPMVLLTHLVVWSISLNVAFSASKRNTLLVPWSSLLALTSVAVASVWFPSLLLGADPLWLACIIVDLSLATNKTLLSMIVPDQAKDAPILTYWLAIFRQVSSSALRGVRSIMSGRSQSVVSTTKSVITESGQATVDENLATEFDKSVQNGFVKPVQNDDVGIGIGANSSVKSFFTRIWSAGAQGKSDRVDSDEALRVM